MGDIEIRGGAEARRIAAAFDKAAVRDLSQALQRGLEDGVAPLADAAHRAALEQLPRRGGLNVVVAAARIVAHVRGGRNPSAHIVADGIDQINLIDQAGVVDHPTYGHRPRVRQSIPRARGWFTDTMQNGAPGIRRALDRQLNQLARKIESAGRG